MTKDLLNELIQALTILPGVGKKSAQRMALYLLDKNKQGAKIMASTASNLIKNPEKIVEAKKEFESYLSKNPYICPIPEGVMPPIQKD